MATYSPPPTPTVGKQRNVWKWLVLGCLGSVVLIGLCSVLGVFGLLATSSETTDTPDVVVGENTRPDAEAAASPVAQANVGDDVQVGDVRWKVLNAENRGDTLESENEFIDDVTTPGTFIFVEFEVENLATQQTTLSNVDLVDGRGRTFSPSSDATSFIDTNRWCLLQTLNPNVPRTCESLYEVPADAEGLALYVGDLSLVGDAEAQINLNLD